MKKEFSFGIIPLQQREDQWWVYLVQHLAGHWAFPKGHGEEGEFPQETAQRELKEETGLDIVRFLSPQSVEEHYDKPSADGGKVLKTVVYYLAEVSGKVILDHKELQAGRWVLLDKVQEQLTFSEAQSVAKRAEELLSKERTKRTKGTKNNRITG